MFNLHLEWDSVDLARVIVLAGETMLFSQDYATNIIDIPLEINVSTINVVVMHKNDSGWSEPSLLTFNVPQKPSPPLNLRGRLEKI